MGVGHSCFGQSSTERLVKEESNEQNVCLTTSIIKFIKPRCFWTEEEKQKRQLQLNEKHQHQLKMAKKERTLEEWILASPGLNKFCNTSGGEYYVFNFSSKIYPSLSKDNVGSPPKNKGSFSLEGQRLKVDEHDMEAFSLSESQSMKVKKRVSFRLPEEADIFIFYSPEEFEE